MSMRKARVGSFSLIALVFVLAAMCSGALFACASSSAPANPTSLDQYEASDMSGYECAAGYEQPYCFVDMTVDDIAREVEAGSTFAFYSGFDTCPWCGVMLNSLNDAAIEAGAKVGYLDTRADPSWSSNLDIDGYDTFVELFGSALDEDDDGKKHLYVPHVFFIKDGKLVYDHAGTVPGQASPSDALSDEQLEELKGIYRQGFDEITS